MVDVTIGQYNESALKLGEEPQFRAAVMTIHGMLARGVWQKEITPELQMAGFLHIPIDIGNVALGAIGPFAQWSAKRVNSKIQGKYDFYLAVIRKRGLAILAHSFGTYCVASCLRSSEWICVRRLIFVGSIVRCDFPWGEVVVSCKIKRVWNELGANDIWVKIARFFIGGSGPSGVEGFSVGGEVVINRPHLGVGHSDLLKVGYLREAWFPFLNGECD